MAAVASENLVDPAPTTSPSISRSTDNGNLSRRLSVDSPQSSSATADTFDRPFSTPSPSRLADPQGQPPSKVEEYRQLFRLPLDEVLIQDFNCALQENFLLQGHMYLFVHCICFYSNLFGFETKKIIPFHEITSVRRAKAVAVFPTAIEIIAGGKKYFFTSFLSRDEAFKLINDGWLQHSSGAKETMDQQEPTSDIISEENGSTVVEEPGGFGVYADESPIIASEEDTHVAEDSEVGEPDVVATSLPMQVREEENSETAQTIISSSSAKSSAWEADDAEAPGVPECFTKVAESKFAISVEEFFNMFFSDNAVGFQELFHRKCGDKDFKCTPWRRHEKFGHTRDVSFQHPIKVYFGARCGSCQEVVKYKVYRNSHLIIDSSQEITDVPYGDYFSVEGLWDVEESNESTPGCIIRVYTNVAFSKKTMWKGKIVQSTVEECREVYAIWIDLAHEVLKQKNLEKAEAVRSSNLIPIEQVQLEKQADTQSYEVESSIARMSQFISEPTVVNQRVTDPIQGTPTGTSVGSVMGDIFTKFCTSFKQQNKASLLLVITIAIVLVLMQISILVLLSRPQRIHIIPQSDCGNRMHGIGENRAEALSLVNKQINYLKEEMHFVETLLEKMQNEHTALKGKLKELELFRNQRI